MLEQLRTHLQQELSIPEILSERCVHAHLETASCRACVDRCPQQAWRLDDASLSIDIAACDSCGLCASACPQGAILHSHEPLLGQSSQSHLLALVACEKTNLPAGAGLIPCLHALSLHDVLKLYRQGVREIFSSSEECATCPRQIPEPLSGLLQMLNTALHQRECPPISLHSLTPSAWQTQRQTLKPPVSNEPLSRRHFFRRGLQSVVQESLKLRGLLQSDREHFPPPATLLPASEITTALLPYVPQIDPHRCNGCDTCFKICPHEALLWDVAKNAYIIRAERCTGCQICVDICALKAILVTFWVTPTLPTLPLRDARCRYCGVPFHQPVAYAQNHPQTCQICSRVNHYRNLFQVLE